jgi:hypothetical protein
MDGFMNYLLLIAALSVALPATAQQPTSNAKYARCAGSQEMEKCRALVDSIASETPEAKRARAQKLESERAASANAVAQQPLTYRPSTQRVVSDPAIGMSEYEASNTMWGRPQSINRTETRYGTREQWVYGGGRYLYLENGNVTAISSRY